MAANNCAPATYSGLLRPGTLVITTLATRRDRSAPSRAPPSHARSAGESGQGDQRLRPTMWPPSLC